MADLGPLGFNPAEVENMGDGFKVLPPGIYTVIIVEPESICRYLDVHKKNQQIPENKILCAGGEGEGEDGSKDCNPAA